MRIIFASNNNHKLCDIKNIIPNMADKIKSLKEIGINVDPEENGKTFEENAIIKARAVYEEMVKHNLFNDDDIILADDSGICIDFFNGEPGIYSARFMGHDTPQIEKNKKIIEEMKNVEDEKRKAQFHSVICEIRKENGKIVERTHEGIFEGSIAKTIEGEEGFGFDPIFIPNGEEKTVATLGEEYKSTHSHRYKSLSKVKF